MAVFSVQSARMNPVAYLSIVASLFPGVAIFYAAGPTPDVHSPVTLKSVWVGSDVVKVPRMQERSFFEIVPVRTADDLAMTGALFIAYAASLDVDLSYQDFDSELATMPGQYAPPEWELLLARALDGRPIGCVALRPIAPAGCCEMKRLYVSPLARGFGLGKALAEALIDAAERIGYREMRLDSLPSMTGAQALYRKLGFTETDPHYDTPVAGTLFMRRPLAPR
jgi:ribosomal protein S18 acetylase RimI-like enzyme